MTPVQAVCPCLFSRLPLLSLKLLFSGFPDRTSCPDTGGPTRVSNRTSVKCARRSLPAATTCPNTSKSTVFHESAGRFALQTDARGWRGPRISGKPGGSDGLILTRTQATGAGGRGRECTGVAAFRPVDRSPSAGARLALSFQQTVIVN